MDQADCTCHSHMQGVGEFFFFIIIFYKVVAHPPSTHLSMCLACIGPLKQWLVQPDLFGKNSPCICNFTSCYIYTYFSLQVPNNGPFMEKIFSRVIAPFMWCDRPMSRLHLDGWPTRLRVRGWPALLKIFFHLWGLNTSYIAGH